MPDETVDAFRDHGRAAATVETRLDDERRVLDRLAAIGIDMEKVTGELSVEGVDKFAKPFDLLLEALGQKRQALAAGA